MSLLDQFAAIATTSELVRSKLISEAALESLERLGAKRIGRPPRQAAARKGAETRRKRH